MTSPLCRDDINEIWSNGGKVTVDDIVRLNAIALKITDNPATRLAVLPRFVSVNGVHFREPNVEQSMFLDEARAVFPDDDGTQLAITAYVLAHDDADIKQLRHPFLFRAKVAAWMLRHMRKCTIEEIEQIVYYCITGCEQTTGEYPPYVGSGDNEDRIGGPKSWALFDYLESAALGIDSVAALRATSPQLSAMIERAYVVNKTPLSNTANKLTADYYRTLDEIKQRAFPVKEGAENG